MGKGPEFGIRNSKFPPTLPRSDAVEGQRGRARFERRCPASSREARAERIQGRRRCLSSAHISTGGITNDLLGIQSAMGRSLRLSGAKRSMPM